MHVPPEVESKYEESYYRIYLVHVIMMGGRWRQRFENGVTPRPSRSEEKERESERGSLTPLIGGCK